MVPSSDDSTGTTAAATSPPRTASNAARNDETGTASGDAKNRSTASSANAPGSPVYATRMDAGLLTDEGSLTAAVRA
jgi:hypothetical protein